VPSGFGAKSTGACGSRAGAVVVVVVGPAVVVVVGAWAVAVVEDVGAWTRWVVAVVAVLPGALRPVLDVVAASVDEVVLVDGRRSCVVASRRPVAGCHLDLGAPVAPEHHDPGGDGQHDRQRHPCPQGPPTARRRRLVRYSHPSKSEEPADPIPGTPIQIDRDAPPGWARIFTRPGHAARGTTAAPTDWHQLRCGAPPQALQELTVMLVLAWPVLPYGSGGLAHP